MSENKKKRDWPIKFCQLTTLIVDDRSIDRGIIAPSGIAQVMFFFMRCIQHPDLRSWLITTDTTLKEGNFIKLIAWLESEHYFSAKSKMKLIRYLQESGEFEHTRSIEGFKSLFKRKLPPDIERIVKTLI